MYILGYYEDTKVYRLIRLETKKIIKSCNVEFLEHKNTYEYFEMCLSRSNGIFVSFIFNFSKE